IVRELVMRVADALDEDLWYAQAISLNRRKTWHGLSAKRAGQIKRARLEFAEVIDSPEIHGEIGLQRDVIDVRSELHAVAAELPRNVICVLIALLGATHVAEWFAAEESETRNVDGDASAFRVRRKVVEQAAARVLKTRFIDFVGAHCPDV